MENLTFHKSRISPSVVIEAFENIDKISFEDVAAYCKSNNYQIPSVFRQKGMFKKDGSSIDEIKKKLDVVKENIQKTSEISEDSNIENIVIRETSKTDNVKNDVEVTIEEEDYSTYIPEKDKNFVSPGGSYILIEEVIKTHEFFPCYIWGASGLGKSTQVIQLCAKHSRPLFRVQINKDMTNDDILGSFHLIKGETKWCDGPALRAYRSGGVLLLDEIDLNPYLMVLQGILENKPIYVPQTGEVVKPKPGFTVIATGNSSGDGEGSVEFVGTSSLNKAFLERFVTIFEQKIPTIDFEEKVINKYCANENILLEEPIKEAFLKWIEAVRKTYKEDLTTIYISTRRIQHILKIYKIGNNIKKALEYGLAMYPEEERTAFLNTWKAIYEG